MEYTAQEDKQPATSSGLKHYIGWYDAEAGTLEYLEVKKMIVRGMVKAKKAPEEAFAQRTMRAVILAPWPPGSWAMRLHICRTTLS